MTVVTKFLSIQYGIIKIVDLMLSPLITEKSGQEDRHVETAGDGYVYGLHCGNGFNVHIYI